MTEKADRIVLRSFTYATVTNIKPYRQDMRQLANLVKQEQLGGSVITMRIEKRADFGAGHERGQSGAKVLLKWARLG